MKTSPTSGEALISSSLPLLISVTKKIRPASRSGLASSGRARSPSADRVVSMHTPTFSMISQTRSILSVLLMLVMAMVRFQRRLRAFVARRLYGERLTGRSEMPSRWALLRIAAGAPLQLQADDAGRRIALCELLEQLCRCPRLARAALACGVRLARSRFANRPAGPLPSWSCHLFLRPGCMFERRNRARSSFSMSWKRWSLGAAVRRKNSGHVGLILSGVAAMARRPVWQIRRRRHRETGAKLVRALQRTHRLLERICGGRIKGKSNECRVSPIASPRLSAFGKPRGLTTGFSSCSGRFGVDRGHRELAQGLVSLLFLGQRLVEKFHGIAHA